MPTKDTADTALLRTKDTADTEWLRKRQTTTIGFAIYEFLIACQNAVLLITVWVYIKQLIKTDYPKTLYALIMSSGTIAGIVVSPLVGKLADRYRNVRMMFCVGSTLKIIGNLMYTVHFSPSYLLVGRMISGMAEALDSVVTGELARCYGKKELARKLAIIGFSGAVGFMIGPCINLPFTSLDVRFGELRITYANVSGIYMSVLYFATYFINFFMIHNLSKEFDMKQCTEGNFEEVEKADDTNTSNHNDISIREVIMKCFTHIDTSLIMALTLFESLIITTIHVCYPFLVIDVLKWSPVTLNIIILGSAISFLLPVILLIYFKPSDAKLYMFAVMGIFSFSIMLLVFIVLKLTPQHLVLNVILVVIKCVLQGSTVLNRYAFQKAILAKLVASRWQSSADSVRFSCEKIGRLVGILSSPFAFSRIEVVGSVYAAGMVVLGMLTVARRKTLSDPRVII